MTIDFATPIPPERLVEEHARDWAAETRARASLLRDDLAKNLPAASGEHARRLAASLEAAVQMVVTAMGGQT